MAHFAKLGLGNIVEKVVVVNNEVITDENGLEQEQLGIDFLNNLYNTRDVWVKTSYNANFRVRFAGKGMMYDRERDAFYYPQKFKSWTFDEEKKEYVPPVPYPTIDINNISSLNKYVWNEIEKKWEIGL
jgi:hypothetical protein